MRPRILVWASLALSSTGLIAQQPAPDPPQQAEPVAHPAGDTPVSPDKRIFGVLPNYRTVDPSQAFHPLTAGQKFHIAYKDSFDWPSYLVGGAFATLYQLEDSNPSFGQGMKGYAHRYVTAQADQVAGNMLTEGLFPAVFHEDPRYFRLGEGSGWKRTRYALTRMVVTRTDSNGSTFNFSEWLGNGVTAAIGNAYYPDNRTLFDTTQRMYTGVATDAFSNVLKEFWPDIKRRWLHHRDAQTARAD